MKRRDFVRSGTGAIVGLFAGGAKLLTAARPTPEKIEVARLSSIGTDVGPITAGQIRSNCITVTKLRSIVPPHHPMCRCVILADDLSGHRVMTPINVNWSTG